MSRLSTTASLVKGSPIFSQIEIVTPERAQILLDSIRHQRPLNVAAVKRYSRRLADGSWRLNGENMIISDEDHLLDGQHRCTAIIETGISTQMNVTYGVADHEFASMGQIAPRTAADTVGIQFKAEGGSDDLAGVTVSRAASLLAGTIRNATILENLWTVMSYSADNETIKSAYSKDGPNLIAAVVKAQSISLLTPSQSAALYYHFAKLDRAWADVWAQRMATGAGLTKDDPVLNFRERLVDANSGKNKSKKIPAIDRLAMGVRVWNFLVTGNTITLLQGVKIIDGKKTFPKAVKPTIPAPAIG